MIVLISSRNREATGQEYQTSDRPHPQRGDSAVSPRTIIESVTRGSSRVAFPKAEFQWNGGDLSLHRRRMHPHRMLQADSSRSAKDDPYDCRCDLACGVDGPSRCGC